MADTKNESKVVCPRCGGQLRLSILIDYDINEDGTPVNPIIDRDVFCSDCECDGPVQGIKFVEVILKNPEA